MVAILYSYSQRKLQSSPVNYSAVDVYHGKVSVLEYQNVMYHVTFPGCCQPAALRLVSRGGEQRQPAADGAHQ